MNYSTGKTKPPPDSKYRKDSEKQILTLKRTNFQGPLLFSLMILITIKGA